MNSSRLLRYFYEYTNKIDMNNSFAKSKYFHSTRSMELARNIANDLAIFDEEEIVVIELIALFHDIGNFNEKDYNYLDNNSEDSTMKSINVLFEEGLIRKITKETKYDNIIKLAIFCHNKDGLPKNIDDKTICICNIMKDVYYLEELYMAINSSYIDNRINDYPTPLVYNEFKQFKGLNSKLSDNNADNILIILSNLFKINYKTSYNIILEKDYINTIIDRLIIEDKKIDKFFNQIKTVLNNYIKKQLN